MKKLVFTTLSIIMLVGCASNRSGSTEETSTKTPEWWFNPAASETHFFAFGQAKKQNPSLAQKIATQRARDDISNQVKSNVQNEIRDYMQESGLAKMKDGTVYVRVSYSKDGVDKALLNAAKREEALYNEFKASQAFDRLEKKFSGN